MSFLVTEIQTSTNKHAVSSQRISKEPAEVDRQAMSWFGQNGVTLVVFSVFACIAWQMIPQQLMRLECLSLQSYEAKDILRMDFIILFFLSKALSASLSLLDVVGRCLRDPIAV